MSFRSSGLAGSNYNCCSDEVTTATHQGRCGRQWWVCWLLAPIARISSQLAHMAFCIQVCSEATKYHSLSGWHQGHIHCEATELGRNSQKRFLGAWFKSGLSNDDDANVMIFLCNIPTLDYMTSVFPLTEREILINGTMSPIILVLRGSKPTIPQNLPFFKVASH